MLEERKASEYAVRAFMIHPMFQADIDLVNNFELLDTLHPKVVALVLEYRSKANAWLSDKIMPGGTLLGLPSPGPLPEVRDMLWADKSQNYKDFLLYHKNTHPRNFELDIYFREWLKVL